MIKYEIIINPKLLNQLNKDIWSDDTVPCILKIGDSRYKIWLSYRGNVLRKSEKKSYHIIFQKPFLVDGAHEIHLNAEFNDISLSRNKLSLDFFNRIGVSSPHSRHVMLYINGICKVIYLELESFDQYLLKKRNLPKGPIIYATNYHANFSLFTPENKLKTKLTDGYTLKNGSDIDLGELEQFIAMINTAKNEEFKEKIHHYLNVDVYLKWLAGAVCTQNYDGFIHNYALYKNGKTGLYEISPWDYDGTWGRDLHGKIMPYDYVPITGYNSLTKRLLYFENFKKKYQETLVSILDTEFTPAHQEEIVSAIFQNLLSFIKLDPFIKLNETTLEKEKELISTFITDRSNYLRKNLNKLT